MLASDGSVEGESAGEVSLERFSCRRLLLPLPLRGKFELLRLCSPKTTVDCQTSPESSCLTCCFSFADSHSLEQVSQIATLASENLATVGASLAHVHVPGRELIQDELGDEIEIGMGIHNEEGFARVKATLKGLVETMLKQLLDQSDTDRAYINVKSGDEVVVMVNNLGGISPLELGAITTEVIDQLDASYQIKPARLLSGTYMTSLNGLGFSITILKAADKAILPLIDAPADAAGWSPAVHPENWARGVDTTKSESKEDAPIHDDSAPSNLECKSFLFFELLYGA